MTPPLLWLAFVVESELARARRIWRARWLMRAGWAAVVVATVVVWWLT